MKGGYFLRNGQFCKEEEAVFTLSDLSHRANGIAVSFRAEHNEPLFAESICQFLLTREPCIRMELYKLIDPEASFLRKNVSRLLNKNKLYLAAAVTLQLFSTPQGLQWALSARETTRGFFPSRPATLLLGWEETDAKEEQEKESTLSFSLAERESPQKNPPAISQEWFKRTPGGKVDLIPDGIIGYILGEEVRLQEREECDSNTPLTDILIHCIREAGFAITPVRTIYPADLYLAEELFVFDAVEGFTKILGFEKHRYFSSKTQMIAQILSEKAEADRKRRE
ncbi:MAG: hypothetical protein LWW85_03860 [Marinilabiliales bacterium]|nr:hypothetical protein [Marinilabiliales bacterium]